MTDTAKGDSPTAPAGVVTSPTEEALELAHQVWELLRGVDHNTITGALMLVVPDWLVSLSLPGQELENAAVFAKSIEINVSMLLADRDADREGSTVQ